MIFKASNGHHGDNVNFGHGLCTGLYPQSRSGLGRSDFGLFFTGWNPIFLLLNKFFVVLIGLVVPALIVGLRPQEHALLWWLVGYVRRQNTAVQAGGPLRQRCPTGRWLPRAGLLRIAADSLEVLPRRVIHGLALLPKFSPRGFSKSGIVLQPTRSDIVSHIISCFIIHIGQIT